MTKPIQKARDFGDMDSWAARQLPGAKELSNHHAAATAAQRHGVKGKTEEEKSGGTPVKKDFFHPAGGKLGVILGGVKKHAQSREQDPKATQRRPSGYDQVHSRMGNQKSENLQKLTSLKNNPKAAAANPKLQGEYSERLRPISSNSIKKIDLDLATLRKEVERVVRERASYPQATIEQRKYNYNTERIEKLKP